MKLKNLILSALTVLCLVLFAVGIVGCSVKKGNNSGSASNSGDNSTSSASTSASTGNSGSGGSEDLVVVTGVNMNTDLLTYNSNKKVKADADKENEFFDLTQNMLVGDDNAFSVKPSVAFRIFKGDSDIPEAYVPESWTYFVNAYVKNGDNYVLLEGQDVTTYIDAIDAVNATVDFSADAVGHQFKLEVYPDGLTEKQSADADYKMTLEFEVIDGYNVYSAKELAYIDNGANYLKGSSYNDAWAKFKTDNGLTATSPAALIMQTNLTITKDDIPSIYFWSESEVSKSDGDYLRVVGSLKDRNYVYFRNLGADGSFLFEGNYFTLDCRSFSHVVRPNDDIVAVDETFESHSSLFYFGSEAQGETSNSAFLKDVNFIGNSPRVEDTTKSGGVILVKNENVAFTAYNNISNCFVINYMIESTSQHCTLEKCKAFDSFTTLMYVWGASDVNIVDSQFVGAGGPVMIVDHTHVTDENGGTPSCVTVTNSELHSYVTGQEAWFTMYNAGSIISQIVMMNGGFMPFGRSFVKTRTTGDGTLNFIDFVALYKSGEAEAVSTTKISGKFVEDNAALAMDFGTYTKPWDNFQTNGPASTYIETVLGVNAALPIFMTSGGGMSFFAPEAFPAMGIGQGLNTINFGTGAPEQIMDPTDNMFKGDQLYLYYSRMGIVFNYFNAGETI